MYSTVLDRDRQSENACEREREISGLKRGDDYVEVTCGCTSHRYGDAVGRLRVFVTGDLEITCECTPGCQEDKMTPAAFEKHSGRETARKRKNNVWVILSGEKVPLFKTPLLKYYNQASKGANGSHRSHNGRVCHSESKLEWVLLGCLREREDLGNDGKVCVENKRNRWRSGGRLR
ncbi:protein ULTRAPETALA 1-like [Camellia sinensis]|uniref:protein ULTRAPETALA 1-like n=1 Tax=Camellia sinensis TaxID=4442 RepID=UPI0010367648|nr:protein ULTRAPETALA 1-like [Camellia sinensis]